jgi:hypothetical protein
LTPGPDAVPPVGTLSAESPEVVPDEDATPFGATPTALSLCWTVEPQPAARAATTAKLVAYRFRTRILSA